MLELRRPHSLWYLLLAVTSGVLLLALLPPFLPVEMEAAVRHGFASVCHQLPSRSLHIGDIPLAICDRCSGIYSGLVVGVAVTGWSRDAWGALGQHGRYLLVGSLLPLGLDWVAPLFGLWTNGPLSRILTGLLFGSVAASYVTHRLLRRVARTDAPEGPLQ